MEKFMKNSKLTSVKVIESLYNKLFTKDVWQRTILIKTIF